MLASRVSTSPVVMAKAPGSAFAATSGFHQAGSRSLLPCCRAGRVAALPRRVPPALQVPSSSRLAPSSWQYRQQHAGGPDRIVSAPQAAGGRQWRSAWHGLLPRVQPQAPVPPPDHLPSAGQPCRTHKGKQLKHIKSVDPAKAACLHPKAAGCPAAMTEQHRLMVEAVACGGRCRGFRSARRVSIQTTPVRRAAPPEFPAGWHGGSVQAVMVRHELFVPVLAPCTRPPAQP